MCAVCGVVVFGVREAYFIRDQIKATPDVRMSDYIYVMFLGARVSFAQTTSLSIPIRIVATAFD